MTDPVSAQILTATTADADGVARLLHEREPWESDYHLLGLDPEAAIRRMRLLIEDPRVLTLMFTIGPDRFPIGATQLRLDTGAIINLRGPVTSPGIEEALVDELITHARVRGLKAVTLSVPEDAAAAVAERFGMTVVERDPDFTIDDLGTFMLLSRSVDPGC